MIYLVAVLVTRHSGFICHSWFIFTTRCKVCGGGDSQRKTKVAKESSKVRGKSSTDVPCTRAQQKRHPRNKVYEKYQTRRNSNKAAYKCHRKKHMHYIYVLAESSRWRLHIVLLNRFAFVFLSGLRSVGTTYLVCVLVVLLDSFLLLSIFHFLPRVASARRSM